MKKHLQTRLDQFSRRAGAASLGIGLALASFAARAELDSSITTQLNSVKADGLALGALVLVVIIAIAAFKLLRRAI